MTDRGGAWLLACAWLCGCGGDRLRPATPPDAETRHLTVFVGGAGAGTVAGDLPCDQGACERDFPLGTRVTLSASGEFDRWDGDCAAAGRCTLVMDRDRQVTATFTHKATQFQFVHARRTGVGAGTITWTKPEGVVPVTEADAIAVEVGSKITLIASPGPGSALADWTGPCADSRSAECVIAATSPVPRDVTVVARFVPAVPLHYELTWLPEGFSPRAMNPAGRIGGTISGPSGIAAVYDPSTKTMNKLFAAGGNDSWVHAINARGDVAGSISFDPRYGGVRGMHPFVRYADGHTEILTSHRGMPVTSGEAVAIDGTGRAYGYAGLLAGGGLSLFALTRDAEMSFFGDAQDVVMGVSPSGMPVGCRYDPAGEPRPVVFRNGAAVRIAPDLPAFSGCLAAANDAGLAVGGFQTDRDIGAYLWDGATARVLPLEVATSVNAYGIVAGGKVVAPVLKAGDVFRTHAALWLGGAEAQDLNALLSLDGGVELLQAMAINDAGAIAGVSSKGGFLLTPKR